MENPYSNRELDHKFNDIHDKLDLILVQTTKHNGRLSKVERTILVLGTAMVVLLITSGSNFIVFLKSLI